MRRSFMPVSCAVSCFHRSLRIEQLERRDCPAFTASMFSGSLVFDGTNGHDQLLDIYGAGTPAMIWFRTATGDWTLGGAPPITPVPTTFPVPTAAAPISIIINGYSGNDLVDLRFGPKGNLFGFPVGSVSSLRFNGHDNDDQFLPPQGVVALPGPGADPNIHFLGGNGKDDLQGGLDPEEFFGEGDIDTALAGGGDDVLNGGDANDILHGEDGDDRIDGGDGNDMLFGENNQDTIHGDADDDQISGGDHDDRLYAGTGVDTVNGNDGNDNIYGEGLEGEFLLDGGSGTDSILGSEGPDDINGGPDADSLFGFGDTDVIKGGGGGDTIYGGDGADEIWGEDDGDILIGNAGPDTMHGGLASDTLFSGEAYEAADQPYDGIGGSPGWPDMKGSGEEGCDEEDGHADEDPECGYLPWVQDDAYSGPGYRFIHSVNASSCELQRLR